LGWWFRAPVTTPFRLCSGNGSAISDIWPKNPASTEQRIHAQILAGRSLVRLCDLPDVLGGRLTPVLAQALAEPLRPGPGVALNGARQYPRLLAELLR
jgi:predicted glycosyltransferase